jgi:hypothetical protein
LLPCNGQPARETGDIPMPPPDGKARSAGDNAGDEVIMSIAGHVSRAMLSRYSHSRMEAKRRALDEIAARHRAAEAKRREAEQGGRSKRLAQNNQ